MDDARLAQTCCVCYRCVFFFFNDTATTEIYTLSLHDALPISPTIQLRSFDARPPWPETRRHRSEEHTSELQSLAYLVCRLLLEKKKTTQLRQKQELEPDAHIINIMCRIKS